MVGYGTVTVQLAIILVSLVNKQERLPRRTALQSYKPSRDVVPSCFMEIARLVEQAVISRGGALQSPAKTYRAAAVGKSATRRRTSRIILALVVNASKFKPSTPKFYERVAIA